jgi:hypothetical protein
MRVIIKLGVALLLFVLFGGLVVTSISRVRHAAKRISCANNLHSIGMALELYQDFHRHFPTGTVPNTELPPDRRLSWLVQIYPTFMVGGIGTRIEMTRAWDAEENCPPRCFCKHTDNHEMWYAEEEMGEVLVFFCPANLMRTEPALPSATHYVGVAGLGEDAAELPLSDPRAGMFGYDRKVALSDLKHGAATTLALAEVVEGGPWTAGGRATVRGLSADGVPYVGQAGQFTSRHPTGSLSWPLPVVTNVAFVDASVRGLTASVSPEVFEKLVTIGGSEPVGPFDAE